MLLAVLACVLWGSAFAGAKIGFEYMPPIMLSGLRFSLAGILLLPVVMILKVDWRKDIKYWRFMLFFGFIQTFLQYGLFFMGLNLVPGAVAAIIIGAGPVFVTILAHLTMKNDRFTPRKIISISLGMIGVIFISLNKGDVASVNPNFYYGVALLLFSNIVGSSTNIIVAKRENKVSPVLLTMVANFTGGVMLFIVSLFAEDTSNLTKGLPLEFYAALLWLAIIPAAAFSIWYYLLGIPGVKVSELNIWKFIVPIVGAVLSWILIPGESPDMVSVIGIIIISTSIIVLQGVSKPKGSQF